MTFIGQSLANSAREPFFMDSVRGGCYTDGPPIGPSLDRGIPSQWDGSLPDRLTRSTVPFDKKEQPKRQKKRRNSHLFSHKGILY